MGLIQTGINLHDSSQRHKNNCDLDDRISALPDSILGHILSFLPSTAEAVATSILSKRWKFTWVTVHNLYFTDDCGCFANDGSEDTDFVRFVNRVFLLHDAGMLNEFILSLLNDGICISSPANSWINTAIAKNVHHLYLDGDIDLSSSVFSCDSLHSLYLSGGMLLPDVFDVYLPRLKKLTLIGIYFQIEEDFEKVISGCPMLNYLTLVTYHDHDDDFTYIISSTSLQRVEVDFDETGSSLELNASLLEYLKIYGWAPKILVQKSLSSLVEAYFNIHLPGNDFYQVEICNSIVESVRAFKCAKALTLSVDVIRAFSCVSISLSTKFERLVRLVIDTSYHSYHRVLQDFIRSSDNLEFLQISNSSRTNVFHDDHSMWTAPGEVPKCLSNSLKKVQLTRYKDLKDERELIRYLLKHGCGLEVMQIYCGEGKKGKEFELVQEISGFSKKSPVCEIQFSWWAPDSEYKLP